MGFVRRVGAVPSRRAPILDGMGTIPLGAEMGRVWAELSPVPYPAAAGGP